MTPETSETTPETSETTPENSDTTPAESKAFDNCRSMARIYTAKRNVAVAMR